eukprot:scaffold5934_cov170-Amphora_coffeaeformis.AAC.1
MTRRDGIRLWNYRSTTNQDDMGHRACEGFVGRMSSSVSRGQQVGIIVDCTNATAKHRRDWLTKSDAQPTARLGGLIFCRYYSIKRVARVRGRIYHPSIPFGLGDRIVEGFARKLEPPTEDEKVKFFGWVRVIQLYDDLQATLAIWSIIVNGV